MRRMRRSTNKILIATWGSLCALLTANASRAVDGPKDDPEARRLMDEAHESRAVWKDFTGFSARVAANHDGKESSGTVEVDAKGGVRVSVPDAATKAWVAEVLGSVVQHRLDHPESRRERAPTSWGGQDGNDGQGGRDGGRDGKHPLGRLVKAGDPFHSSFRIRDHHVTQVNRTKPDGTRFSINMVETTKTAEGKHLPSHFTVFYFDKANVLARAETTTDQYVRVGAFDLPASRRTITAKDGHVAVKQLTLSEHKLVGIKTAAK